MDADPDDWITADPQASLAWAKTYLVADLREGVAGLRRKADFLECKIGLLEDILSASVKPLDGAPPRNA